MMLYNKTNLNLFKIQKIVSASKTQKLISSFSDSLSVFSKIPVNVLNQIDKAEFLKSSSKLTLIKNKIKNFISIGIFSQTISFNYLLSIFFRISGYFLGFIFLFFAFFQFLMFNFNFISFSFLNITFSFFILKFFYIIILLMILYHLNLGIFHILYKFKNIK